MKLKRLFYLAACIGLFLMILASGCAEPEPETIKVEPQEEEVLQEPVAEIETPALVEPQIEPEVAEPGVNMLLNLTPGDITTYEVKTVDTQEVKWEGSVPESPSFEDGRNYTRSQIKFTQEIISLDADGSATAKITIDSLKFRSILKNKTIINFDSTKMAAGNILANLIGNSYTISITPDGKMTSINTFGALKGLGGESSQAQAARNLLKSEVIRKRHALVPLPDMNQNPVQLEGEWSETKTHSFGSMGSNSFEKIYTFEDIEERQGKKVALVFMGAIPSAEAGDTANQAQQSMTQIFDTQETYEGQLRFDLDEGKVEEYSEKLDIQWTVIMPVSGQGDPPVLKMSAIRSYDLKKIN
ncbi:MAG: hypothetical protein ACYTE8_07975 [Planctomycetota bacterium]|jgi:hypothetical protein